MAITIDDQPYSWSARGQKLMIVASSTETANDGFQYGVTVNNVTTGQVFNFYISPAADGNLYFDLQSLIQLRNLEQQTLHNHTGSVINETVCRNLIQFSIAEWWIIGGILTEAEGSSVDGEDILVVNQYYQMQDGYKPNPQTGAQNVKFSITNSTSLAMTDRVPDTQYPKWFSTWNIPVGHISIPVRKADYGLIYFPGNDTYLTNNTIASINIYIVPSVGIGLGQTVTLNEVVSAVPCFPANLVAWAGFTPNTVLAADDWRYIRIIMNNGAGVEVGKRYYLWNEDYYGNCECNWPNVRLAWVGARGGYEYWNFKKKSEYTNEIDRKNYRRNLFNSSPTIFSTYDRGLYQRQNIVQRVLTVTSDFLTQQEFVYLRGLLVSNQVHLVNDDGSHYAVNIDDTSYTEKTSYEGKLYNLTLKVRIANEYWT
jgi:hypothetical protein